MMIPEFILVIALLFLSITGVSFVNDLFSIGLNDNGIFLIGVIGWAGVVINIVMKSEIGEK